MSVDYPVSKPSTPAQPWQDAIGNGPITVGNAEAYTNALKDAVAGDMKVLLFDYPEWDAESAEWYNIPWLAGIRDGIRGSYVGSSFPPAMFPEFGLSEMMTTHVAVYYDHVAAYGLYRLWAENQASPGYDQVPGLEGGSGQFDEGGMIVKPAFTTADASTWPPMEGAFSTPVWASPQPSKMPPPPNELLSVSLFQFDIIVKDTQSTGSSGWVFTTLVWENDAASSASPGTADYFWDKMVPLGAMWGNDPDVDSGTCEPYTPGVACPPLQETWINPAAPLYATETLGWGGRLSGPNDGAVDLNVLLTDGTQVDRLAMSSCMSCHSVAEFKQGSFLLPSPAVCSDDKCRPTTGTNSMGDTVFVYNVPGSATYMDWFQSRPGDVPFNSDAIAALDYGMNNSFKALPTWIMETTGKAVDFVEDFNEYRGLGFDR
jgi:hypothetical protein